MAGKKTGPADPATSSSSDQQAEEKKKYQPCIVTFRPCKDWRGEYGFDWVRDGKEDYEERYSCGFEYIKTHVKPLEKKMGTKEYKQWRKDEEKKLQKKLKDDPNFDYEWHLNFVIKNKCEELKVEPPIDTHAWQERIKDPNYKNPVEEKYTEADDPFDYLYHPKDVLRVMYRVNRAEFGDIWTTDIFDYHNKTNGDMAARESVGVLQSYVGVGMHRASLVGGKDDKKYYYPIYSDKEDPQYSECIVKGKVNCKREMPNSEDLANYIDKDHVCLNSSCPCCRGHMDVDYGHASCGTVKTVTFKRKDAEGWVIHVTYASLQQMDNVEINLYYEDKDKQNRNYRFCYQYDKLFVDYKGDWVELKDIKDDNGLYRDLKHQFLTSNILHNERMDIVNLCANPNLDHITVVIYHAKSIEKVELTPQMGFKRDEQGNPFWNKYPIRSWRESYENRFYPLYFQLEGEEKRRKYCVPMLTMPTFPHKCTKFVTHNYQDAPIKTDQPWNEVKVRVKKIAGECQRLILKPDIPNLVKITPDKIDNFNESEITIKYIGKEKGNQSLIINAYSDQDYYRKQVGQLRVFTSYKGTLPINFIVVETDKAILDAEAKETLQDQMDWTSNLLAQVGFNTEVRKYPMKLDHQFLKKLFPDDEYNTEGIQALFKTFSQMLKDEEKDRFFDYKVIYVPIRCTVEGGSAKGATIYFDIDEDTECAKKTANQPWIACEMEPGVVLFKTMLSNRSYLQVVAHELGHALGLSHHFQRIANPNEPFGFKMSSTSNLMEYYVLSYSTHRYQWQRMEPHFIKYIRERNAKIQACHIGNLNK